MRVSYHLSLGSIITISDIQSSVQIFFERFKILPDVIKIKYSDYKDFLTCLNNLHPQYLESGKKYGLFIPIPGGLVELKLLDQLDEVSAGCASGPIIVIENTQIDKEFEKVVLGEK
jgi:hypothetical protein